VADIFVQISMVSSTGT